MSRPPRSAGGESWRRSAFWAGSTAAKTKRSVERVSAFRNPGSLSFTIIACSIPSPDGRPLPRVVENAQTHVVFQKATRRVRELKGRDPYTSMCPDVRTPKTLSLSDLTHVWSKRNIRSAGHGDNLEGIFTVTRGRFCMQGQPPCTLDR